MKEILEKLIELARQWRAFSRLVNGWCIMDYADGDVHCYFSDNGDYTTVRFITADYGCSRDEVEIAFHSVPQVQGLTVRSANSLEGNIIKYTKLLEEAKDEYNNNSKEEIEVEKAIKVKNLKRQLEELLKGD